MPPARVPIPPYLLSTSWASSTSLPPRYLRAVLQLPGELRPAALRSFCSIAYRAQLQQTAASVVQYEVPLSGVHRSHAFLDGTRRGSRKELGSGQKYIEITGGHVGTGIDGAGTIQDGHGSMEDIALAQGSGIPGGTDDASSSKVPDDAAHHSPSLLSKFKGDIPEDVRRLVGAFMERKPDAAPSIIDTYNEYRRALIDTELGFVAQHLPTVINSENKLFFQCLLVKGEYRFPLLTTVLADFPSIAPSSELKSVLEKCCKLVAKPVLIWADLLATADPAFNEVRQIAHVLAQRLSQRRRRFPTTESICQAYRKYRAELIATERGHIFSDFPSELQPADAVPFDLLRQHVEEERIRLEELEASNAEAEAEHPCLTTLWFNLKMRKMALKPISHLFQRSWELEPDSERVSAFCRVNVALHPQTIHVGEHMIPTLKDARTAFIERIRELRANPNTAEGLRTVIQLRIKVAALEDFFRIVKEPIEAQGADAARSADASASRVQVRTTPHKSTVLTVSPAIPEGRDEHILRQRIATLRSRLFDTHRNSSRDMLEDEVKRLEQSFLASSSRAPSADDVSLYNQASSAPFSISKQEPSLQRRPFRRIPISQPIPSDPNFGRSDDNEASESTSRQVSSREETLVTKDPLAAKLPERGNGSQDSIDLDDNRARARRKLIMNNVIHGRTQRNATRKLLDTDSPPKQNNTDGLNMRKFLTDAPYPGSFFRPLLNDENDSIPPTDPSLSSNPAPQPNIISGTTSDVVSQTPLMNQSIQQSSSDSAAILELRSHVAELKDLIRGLIFHQMSKPTASPSPHQPASASTVQGGPNSILEKLLTEPSLALRETTQKIKHAHAQTDSVISDPSPREPQLNIASQALQKTADTSPCNDSILSDPTSWESSPSKSAPAATTKTTQSLLEELFPEETKQVLVQQSAEKTSAPPRIPVPHMPLNLAEGAAKHQRRISEQDRDRRPIRRTGPLPAISTVLELRYASKSLTEDDFRRLVPRGLHMQEWTQRGEFVKVFPKRNPWTLEQTGNYYIVFDTNDDAKAYMEHVHHVHDLARQHTPTSLTSQLAPPPGYIINGEDVSALVQSFSLIPPQQKLYLQPLKPPFNFFQQNIFKRGGYAQILGEGREGVAQVMIEFLGGRQPSWFDISDAVYLDGRRRGLEWKLLPGESSIRKVDMQKRVEEDEDADAEGNEAGPDALSEFDGTVEGGKRKKTVQERAKTPMYGQRWILSFESVEEAKRFALVWHGRAFPWHVRALGKWRDKGFGEQVLMVRAEFLW